MPIDDLLSVVSPPAHPIEAGNLLDWEIVENRLGLPLPRDFADFGIRYGSGFFLDPGRLKIDIANPFSSRYFEQMESDCAFFREIPALIGFDLP